MQLIPEIRKILGHYNTSKAWGRKRLTYDIPINWIKHLPFPNIYSTSNPASSKERKNTASRADYKRRKKDKSMFISEAVDIHHRSKWIPESTCKSRAFIFPLMYLLPRIWAAAILKAYLSAKPDGFAGRQILYLRAVLLQFHGPLPCQHIRSYHQFCLNKSKLEPRGVNDKK